MNFSQEQVPNDKHFKNLQRAANEAVLPNSSFPTGDISAERSRATFPPEEICTLLNGGRENLRRKAELLKIARQLPCGDKQQRPYLTREEEYVEALRGAFSIWEKVGRGEFTQDDGLILRNLFEMPSGLELHIGMWMPTLRAMATPEQQQRWLEPSTRFEIIGTYAQTELGHGSFLRGLETTATYDKQTRSFVIHSPTPTSTKWWPGGLGKTATHAVVMARLFLDGKDLGPHPFVVQLRSLENHLPLPGITVGDMGPKLGYNGVDNGFLRFDRVRVGRDCLLARFSSVTPAGEYIPPPKGNEKFSYATLVFIRTTLVRDAGLALSKAATIAVRYSAVRRQSAPEAGGQEFQVLDYGNQYANLLPLLATAYAFRFMGKSLLELYYKFEKDRESGDFSLLPELHQLSAGLKAVSTWDAASGIERCRYACGGNGFLQSSGLPRLLTYYLQNVTWDGENSVMALQTARHLVKSLKAVKEGKPVGGSTAYLGSFLTGDSPMTCEVEGAAGWSDPAALLAALEYRATLRIATAADLLEREEAAQGSKDAAWNCCAAELVAAARAHCEAVVVGNFFRTLQALSKGAELSSQSLRVLTKLAALQSIDIIRQDLGDFLIRGYMSSRQADAARLQWRELLKELRPEAVALVDSFGFDDYELHDSAIGRQDGDVYNALLERAAASPLNKSQEGPAYKSVLAKHISSSAPNLKSKL